MQAPTHLADHEGLLLDDGGDAPPVGVAGLFVLAELFTGCVAASVAQGSSQGLALQRSKP